MKIKVTWGDGSSREYTEFDSVERLVASIWGSQAKPDNVIVEGEGDANDVEVEVKPKVKSKKGDAK
jgi:hypothetical protein